MPTDADRRRIHGRVRPAQEPRRFELVLCALMVAAVAATLAVHLGWLPNPVSLIFGGLS